LQNKDAQMKITFLGGADEVGASGVLVETVGRRVLVDCGIRPSPKSYWGLAADQLPALSQIETGSGKLDAILVTHAHTDHTGGLELVVGRYPDVPVYATAPTMALTRVLHQDARRIMQSRLDEEGELPLFDDVAVQQLMSALIPVPFKTRILLADGLAATFFPAGHIAGAAMIGLESDEGRLLISGDVSISPQRTVDGAQPPVFHPDAIILESTYGGRLHANRAVQERNLIETVAQVTAANGKVLIPAFALGRAQEVLLILNEYLRRGELPPVPVWADGMVRTICQAYASFGEALPLALQEQNSQFFNEHIRPIANSEQRNALIWNPGAAIIVSSSGMLAGGPSLSYARALAPKPQHAILLTGYQDEESPGRRLQELTERGSGSIRLGKDKVDVQCRIGTYSLSAHADEAQLISLTESLNPEHVFLVHGDDSARQSLEKALSQRGRIVHLPRAGQTVELKFERKSRFQKPDSTDDPRVLWNELSRQRREKMAEFADAVGKWFLIKGDVATAGLCLALESDHLWLEIAPGLGQSVYPESVLAVLGETPPSDLSALQLRSIKPVVMEPNQALAIANGYFPSAARLRKSGYRLSDHILTLTFDFPDAAGKNYADLISALREETGWQVEITPETNQAALNALVRELRPNGWQIVKGPAIHRDQKRVALSLASFSFLNGDIDEIRDQFLDISGWELDITEGTQTASVLAIPNGGQMEINTAYAHIKSALENSTLYRTSLKGNEIVLSFISHQVAERYQEQVAALALQTGWRLAVNPQPNQGAILEVARALLAKAGFAITKGPSIYPEKAEVSVVLMGSPEADKIVKVAESFNSETGYRLVATSQIPKVENPPSGKPTNFIEIPINRIRLPHSMQGLSLDPDKLEKAIERARRMGISPPIQVRRAADGYILSDGLFRLRAAEALGFERIPAIIE
jgi:Cft2 family RNA processing exonuclease